MLKFEFTIEEANTILMALANQPYQQVVGLIDKIKTQAAPQIASDSPTQETESA